MKIICSGDWHVRATATRYRTSDYYDLMLGKIKWILDFADKNNIFTILQPGDFFDNPSVPNNLLVDIIKLIDNSDVCVVYGQHDTRFRQLDNTALAVLIQSEMVDLLSEKPISYEEKNKVDIYGASWGDKIPKVEDYGNFNILVLHKMIVKDKPLFPDQKDYARSADFSSTCLDYNLIVSGDNHNSFSYIPKDKRFPSIVNCGSLMRMTTAQYTHKPCIWMIDTITGKLEQHFIPIKPIGDVFKPEAVEMQERDEKLEAFIETLATTKTDTQLSFEENLKLLLTEDISNDVKKIANEFIGNYYT